MIYRNLLVSLFLITLNFSLFAQDDEAGKSPCTQPDNKEATKLLEKARDRKKHSFEERIKYAHEAIQLEPDWADANLLLGDFLLTKARAEERGSYKSAVHYYEIAVKACPEIGAEPLYWIGVQYYSDEKYAEAVTWFEKYINYETDDGKKLGKDYETRSLEAQDRIKWGKFYADILSHPRPFDPQIVTGVCTNRNEYLAIITPDNTLAFYIRSEPVSQMDRAWATQESKETFMNSRRQSNQQFDAGAALPEPFNENPNEGGPTLTIDNKHLFYTVTKIVGGKANADIYTTDCVNGEWTPIRPIGERVNDPEFWDSQPTISADGKTLFFASNRPGGQGGIDIWMTQLGTDGQWGVPTNLGSTINTAEDEKSPFMHSDSKTLYFSSKGHPGIGGYDIFFARQDEKGGWVNPVNIGIPINTQNDDLGFFVSSDGLTAFFNTNNSLPGAVGGYDVYQFPLYKEARPERVVLIKGDLRTPAGEPVTGNMTVEIKDVQTRETSTAVVDTSTGQYMAALRIEQQHDYLVTVKKNETAFSSQIVSGKQEFKEVIQEVKPIEVKPLRVGEAYTINDINFTTNSAVIEMESLVVLEEFAAYLKAHPTVRVQIEGHTDNVGDDNQNMILSNQRAYAVYEALTKKFGVSEEQIMGAKGFGETKPVADNGTEVGRARNRRTEFVIVKK
jgi:outer membrane protein OmpA-like peptidoglycan-associated protein